MAVGDANVFPGLLTPVLTQLFFPKPQTTFHTCFDRGERREKGYRTGYRTHNHLVMSPTRSQLTGPWFLRVCSTSLLKTLWEKEKLLVTAISTLLDNFFSFSSNSKLSSANSFSLEESKICLLGKG